MAAIREPKRWCTRSPAASRARSIAAATIIGRQFRPALTNCGASRTFVLPEVSNAYSATKLSSSSPRKRAIDRMKPRLNAPPGSSFQLSFSIASKNRVLMRVAAEISLRETPRISRSRLRCSPKGVEDIPWGPAKNIDADRISVNDTQAQLEKPPIGLSAMARYCPLLQVKMVHYNANVAFRIPRRKKAVTTAAPGFRWEAFRRR